MKSPIIYNLSAFQRKKAGNGCQDPANIWLAWKEWVLIFQFSQISLCPVPFIKKVKSRDKNRMALQALSIHLYPGEQNPGSKQRKAKSIELMNFSRNGTQRSRTGRVAPICDFFLFE
jgi:hypothetical protein